MNVKLPPTRRGDPTWAMALRYPRQGDWTEEEFLELDASSNSLKELNNGVLEQLPLPSLYHQDIATFLFDVLREYLREKMDGGRAYMAPSPIRFSAKQIREPDVFYLSKARRAVTEKYARGADWVLEVVSGSKEDYRRDYLTKRKLYAKAGVAEYWIVDPERQMITVLTIDRASKKYKVHGKFTAGESATSVYFKGLTVKVDEVFRKR